MKDLIQQLVENVKDQAKRFLDDAREFYPFASVINSDGSLVPIGVYLENEYPHAREILTILEQDIKARLLQNKVLVACIALDVLYKANEVATKVDAVKMMILTHDGKSCDYYMPYKVENGQLLFGEVFIDGSTLHL